ncbi:MAG: DddA-like double-stranded DNA deaminase toxin [Stackebrandtia sp.]
MASLDDFIAAMEAAKPHLDAASADVARGCAEGDQVADFLAAAEVRERADVVRGAADKGREGSAAIVTAKNALDEAIAQARRATGGEALTTASSTSTPQTSPPARGSSSGRFDAAGRVDRLPQFVRQRGRRTPTSGVMVGDDGIMTELQSGVDDTTPKIRRHMWDKLGDIGEPATFFSESDVELKAAHRMRDESMGHADVAINNPKGPCPGPLGCDGLLPRFLPAEATMTVHWRDDAGTLRSKTYTGVR